ncbi:hypothetical protein AWC38_SpisGene363 [Stylophora pistillata]|uniref:Uncharacterized protein n=1 Tax=Stylophora pistillata TaxID=50429 RepID=A0A2B4T084_STYPI|nr:hypothetical protein AWC38_SpisGene363 [Stylophora pistillata]
MREMFSDMPFMYGMVAVVVGVAVSFVSVVVVGRVLSAQIVWRHGKTRKSCSSIGSHYMAAFPRSKLHVKHRLLFKVKTTTRITRKHFRRCQRTAVRQNREINGEPTVTSRLAEELSFLRRSGWKDHIVTKNLCWKESAVLFKNARM